MTNKLRAPAVNSLKGASAQEIEVVKEFVTLHRKYNPNSVRTLYNEEGI
jgi:hypothetical protein